MKYTSLSARVWKEQYDIIAKAAKNVGVSIGEYIRRKVMPHAFKDSGVPPKKFPPFVRGAPKAAASLSGKAAAMLGVERKAWEKAILEHAAQAALSRMLDEDDDEPDRPKSNSEFRALTPPPPVEVLKKRQTR